MVSTLSFAVLRDLARETERASASFSSVHQALKLLTESQKLVQRYVDPKSRMPFDYKKFKKDVKELDLLTEECARGLAEIKTSFIYTEIPTETSDEYYSIRNRLFKVLQNCRNREVQDATRKYLTNLAIRDYGTNAMDLPTTP